MDKYKDIIQLDLTDINKYSYSRLRSFEQCPHMFYNTYIKKDRGKQNSYALAGNIAHKIIDEYYKGQYFDFELSSVFENEWQKEFIDKKYEIILVTPNFKKKLTDTYYNSFKNYFENFKAYDNCKIIGTEIKFVLLINNGVKSIIYEGVIDGIGVNKDGSLHVWDSKSKGKWKNKKELDKYLVQLYTYCIYIKYKYKKYPKTLNFNSFRLKEDERVTTENFNIEKYIKAINWIFETVDKIEEEHLFFPEYDEFFCTNLCNFRNTCQYNKINQELETVNINI